MQRVCAAPSHRRSRAGPLTLRYCLHALAAACALIFAAAGAAAQPQALNELISCALQGYAQLRPVRVQDSFQNSEHAEAERPADLAPQTSQVDVPTRCCHLMLAPGCMLTAISSSRS